MALAVQFMAKERKKISVTTGAGSTALPIQSSCLAAFERRGQIYSFSIVRRAVVPYVTALVTLTEGVTLTINIIGPDPESLATGDSVRAVFLPAVDGQMVPFFTPDH